VTGGIGVGFGRLVRRARNGARGGELVAAIPIELAARVAAVGSPAEIATRIAPDRAAGADHVAVVPSTAEDAAGRGVRQAVCSGAAA
jgi:alkanesulfonate monooxygenase SsuD/methylene tetrahydromethanopterin reductase-like flavin-dependent oxidoreductase (luciferase family)